MNKDSLARKVADSFLTLQKRFAIFMNNKTKGCSIGLLKVSFLIICFIYISLSTWSIVAALRQKPGSPIIKVTHMRLTPLIKEKVKLAKIISRNEFIRLQVFRKYLDSLHVCDSLKYKSEVASRHGMLDSLALLEKIYINQK